MPNPQTNLRLDPAIRNKAIAAAKAQGIALATLVERALVAYLDGGVAGDSSLVAGSGPDSSSDGNLVAEQIAALIARVEKLEAGTAPPPLPRPPQTAAIPGDYPTAAPRPARAKAARGKSKGKPENAYTVADALIAAGVCREDWDGRTITEAQVRNDNNRDRTLERVAGMKGGPLLESRGWVKDGHWWYRKVP